MGPGNKLFSFFTAMCSSCTCHWPTFKPGFSKCHKHIYFGGLTKATFPEAHFALKVCTQFKPYFNQLTIWQHGFCIHLAMATKPSLHYKLINYLA